MMASHDGTAAARTLIDQCDNGCMARSSPKLPRVFSTRRVGPLTKDEKALIGQFLADQPHEVTREQIKLLAKLMHRSPNTIRQCIEQARENFVASAGRYVEIHLAATEAALANGDPKSLEVAARGAQWAME